ncbi:MAG: MFS transporter [Burkholderiaceae bacterium]|nr:MFS transporter [Burkholderiaceae bacterium]
MPADARQRSLVFLFAATFAELAGLFMFGPLLLITLKGRGLDTAAVGAFAALQWAGLLAATPFASTWVHRLGPRLALRVSGAVPLLTVAGMVATRHLGLWALLYFVGGLASALRWILAEATVAELASAARRGRVMGLFAMMIGLTFMIGPALLSALLAAGLDGTAAGWVAVALIALGLVLLLPVALPPAAPAAREAAVGWRGTWGALLAAPVVMLTGFVGGFFESGLAGLLPLYGLAAGFSAAMSALLVSASGLGSTLLALVAGEGADRLPVQRLRQACAAACAIATLALPLVPAWPPLAAAIAFVWGGAGASLYTLAMVQIGARHQGVALVNSTAVLVLAYTAGGMVAPAAGALMLQYAPALGFPALLLAVAALGLWRSGSTSSR